MKQPTTPPALPGILTPIPQGWCIKRLNDHTCVDMLIMITNLRMVITPHPLNVPHWACLTYEAGWCYPGNTTTHAIRLAGHILNWNGDTTNPPPGWIKRAL